jgi:hypothetical protein
MNTRKGPAARREPRNPEARSSHRARLAVGTVVRVEAANGDTWSGQVTSFDDRIVGLRGWTMTAGQFRERDAVTLIVGVGERLVSGRAQILTTSGSLMRLVRRDSFGDADQRRAPRLRVELTAMIVVEGVDAPAQPFAVNVIDLSASGCAVSSSRTLLLGQRVTLSLPLPTGPLPLSLTGVVARTWVGDEQIAHTGIQFDSLATTTEQTLHCLLVEQLAADRSREPLPGGARPLPPSH